MPVPKAFQGMKQTDFKQIFRTKLAPELAKMSQGAQS